MNLKQFPLYALISPYLFINHFCSETAIETPTKSFADAEQYCSFSSDNLSNLFLEEDTEFVRLLINSNNAELFCTRQEAGQYQEGDVERIEAERFSLISTFTEYPLQKDCDTAESSTYNREKGCIGELIALLELSIENSNGQSRPLFRSWEDVVLYRAAGGDAAFAQELAAIQNANNSYVFATSEDYISAALLRSRYQITINDIREIHNITNAEGTPLFVKAKDLLPTLAQLVMHKRDLDEYTSYGTITTIDGIPLFNTIQDYTTLSERWAPKQDIEALATLKNKKKEPLFRTGEDAVIYAYSGKDMTYLASLLGIEDANGEQIFSSGAYIAPFARMNGIPADAESLAALVDANNRPLLTDTQVVRYAALGYNTKSLYGEPTDLKPKMLLFLSKSDMDYAFQNITTKKFVEEWRKTYTITPILLEDDTFFASNPAVLDSAAFVAFLGHGSSGRIKLGEGIAEQYYLDTTDVEFCMSLSSLLPNAVIFLFSCSAASGGETADNFANYVASCADRRTVIAGTKNFAASHIIPIFQYPFDARIQTKEPYPYNQNPLTNKSIETDITYKVANI